MKSMKSMKNAKSMKSMKKRSRILALALVSVLSLSLGACGSSDAGKGSAGDAKTSTAQEGGDASDGQEKVDALASAQEKMKEITSMSGKMVMEMDMDVSAEGETQSMQTVPTMDMTCFSDPMHLKVETTVDAGDLGTMDTSTYAETAEDGTYTMYLYDGANWQSQTIQASDLVQYDASKNVASYLQDAYEFEAAGAEQVDGAEAYKYEGAIKGDAMKEALRSSGMLDSSLGLLGTTSDQAESMMDGLGEITIDFWIDKESLYPVKYEMDMTKVVDTLMSNIMESMGDDTKGLSISVPKMKISMTCFDYNEAKEFSIPDEAKAK